MDKDQEHPGVAGVYFIRWVGGPHDGSATIVRDTEYPWPPSEVATPCCYGDVMGRYTISAKCADEATLPFMAMRGVEYQWQPST